MEYLIALCIQLGMYYNDINSVVEIEQQEYNNWVIILQDIKDDLNSN